MAKFWTTHWQFKWYAGNNNSRSKYVASGSNQYVTRGVKPGDYVYVVSLSHGQLYLGRRMIVESVTTRDEAVELLDNEFLHDSDDWIIALRSESTPFRSGRRLAPELTKRIRFLSPSGEVKEPFFVSPTELDVQATRGVRLLTSDTAALFEDILATTDEMTGEFEVTSEMIDRRTKKRIKEQTALPEEIEPGSFYEGASTSVLVNRYERDPEARAACVATHGSSCQACYFDFADTYGPEFAGFIHVHHLVPLSDVGESYEVNPETDLIPVCPNCHSLIHRRIPPYTIDEVQQMLYSQLEVEG